MTNGFQRVLAGAVLVVSFFSLQGCDQIRGFVQYVSPKRTQARPAVLPQTSRAEDAPPVAAGRAQTPPPADIPKDVLAKVGDWSITISDFNQQLSALQESGVEGLDISNPDQKKYILGELLQQQILVQAALKNGMEDDIKVKTAMKAFRDTLLAQIFVEKTTAEIEVSDADAQEFYNEHQQDLRAPDQWQVSEIVVAAEDDARAILAQVKQGASFEELARQKSSGKTASAGGDLGLLGPADFEFEQMGKIVAGLETGAVSDVFEGPQGFYIVKLTDKKSGELLSYDEIREDVKTYVRMMKQEKALQDALMKVQADIQVHINEQLLEE